jgi:hypothetical protein
MITARTTAVPLQLGFIVGAHRATVSCGGTRLRRQCVTDVGAAVHALRRGRMPRLP